MKKYDVIVAGASFAGLAVASRLSGAKVLLIDRHAIGAHQTSACATTVAAVEAVGCGESILRRFDTGTLHTRRREIDIPLPEPFCTFDYRQFCELLARQGRAEFLKASVKRLENSVVVTSAGDFAAGIVVDCTGWQAVLAASLGRGFVDRRRLSCGLETEVPYRDRRLRFFVDRSIIADGVAWLFPCQATARFGIGSYGGHHRLRPQLEKFVARYGLGVGRLHGNYFGHCPREPTVGGLFVVGDAAGHTLPLTGEGIRRSIDFGLLCGELIQEITSDEISHAQGLQAYAKAASRSTKRQRYLLEAQKRLPAFCDGGPDFMFKLLGVRPVVRWAWQRYKAL